MRQGKTSQRHSFFLIAAAVGAMACGALAHAATVTFAQFQQNPASQGFVYANPSVAGAPATFNTVSGGIPVAFEFSNIAGLPTDLQGVQNATLTMTSQSIGTASQPAAGLDEAAFRTTLTFTRDAAAAEGSGSRTNLLTVIQTGDLIGLDGGSTVSLQAPLRTVGGLPVTSANYTSDFLAFPISAGGAIESFSSLNPSGLVFTPTVTGGSSGTLANFTAAGTGTFDIASTTGSGPPVVPEPATLGIVGVGILALLLRRRAGSSLARSL